MSLVAPVEDGKIVETSSQSSLKRANSSNNNEMDKDAFLQLLVAQMNYQDPLEPTSNTEYISQYAQFSQVEQMQNMAGSMNLQRASQLVGEQVRVKTTSSSGDTNYVEGKVDYVAYENGKAYLAINESLYSIDDLDTVVDLEYLEAYNMAVDWVVSLNKLPSVANIDLSNAETIDQLKETYDAMTDYQKSFIASDTVKDLDAYVEKLKEVREAAEEAEKAEESDEADQTEETDGSDAADEAGSAEETDTQE